MSTFQSRLRKGDGNKHPPMRDTTIAHHLTPHSAALSWGVSMGMLAEGSRSTLAKADQGPNHDGGRPITAEEFDRMLAAVPKVRPHDTPVWIRYLTGLWLSGLAAGRIPDSLWDQAPRLLVDLTGRRPAFRIYAEAQKANRDEILPMTPDFAHWLQQTPQARAGGPSVQR